MGREDEQYDPVLKLDALLQEESLESRFQRLLESVFRRICDGGYLPAGDLLAEVEQTGAVAFARDWLSDSRAQPSLDLLCRDQRWNLAIEWYVRRVPYCQLFSESDRELAGRHFADLSDRARWRLPQEQERQESGDKHEWATAAINSLSSDIIYSAQDLLALQRQRDAEFRAITAAQKVEALERELRKGYPFSSSHDVIDYVRGRQDIDFRARFPGVCADVETVDANLIKWLNPIVAVLKPVLDFTDTNIERVAKILNMSKDETLWAFSQRAVFACCEVSPNIKLIANGYLGGNLDPTCYLPSGIFDYVDQNDATLLRTAVVIDKLVLDSQTNILFSFEDLAANSNLRFTNISEATRAERSELNQDEPNDINVAELIRYVQQTQLAITTNGIAAGLSPFEVTHKKTGTEPVARDEREFRLLVDAAGPARRDFAVTQVRSRLGRTFDQLCPEAKTALTGMEFSLIEHVWHPLPSSALQALGIAFEAQLKTSFLQPLAKFVVERGSRGKFPQANSIVDNGHLVPGKNLGAVASVIRDCDPLLKLFCEFHGFDMDRLLLLINAVKDRRNPAAHEGGLSYDLVKHSVDDLFKQQLFEALFPNRS